MTDDSASLSIGRLAALDPVQACLAKIHDWNEFDLFEFADACSGKSWLETTPAESASLCVCVCVCVCCVCYVCMCLCALVTVDFYNK